MFLPLTYATPSYAITQEEYDTQIAQAQADVANAKAELEKQQTELDVLNTSKNEIEASLKVSQLALDQAQINLDATIKANDEQSTVVQDALLVLENAKLNLKNKQDELGTVSNSILEQSSLVTQKTLGLQSETIKLNNLAQSIINFQDNLNTANLQKEQSENDFSLANIAYESAVLNYNASVTNVQILGSTLDNKSNVYSESLNNVQLRLQELTDAQNALDVAQYNYDNNLVAVYPQNSEPTVYGLKAKIYKNATPNYPLRSESAYTYCKTITVTQIAKNWGGGDIEGCGGDNILIHYTGYMTVPTTMNYEFLANVDDGWYMTLDGQIINDNWVLKGCGGWWSSSFRLQAGHSYVFDAWMYEHGGGACNFLYYSSEVDWNIVPASWFTQNQPVQPTYEHDPALLTVLEQKQLNFTSAQEQYLSAYTDSTVANGEYLSAIGDYNNAISDWQIKQDELTTADQIRLGVYQNVITSTLLVNSIERSLQEAQVSYAEQQLFVSQKEFELLLEKSVLDSLGENISEVMQDIQDNINIVNDLENALNNEVKIKKTIETKMTTQTIALQSAQEEVQVIVVMAQSASQKTISQQAIVNNASMVVATATRRLLNIPTPDVPVVEPVIPDPPVDPGPVIIPDPPIVPDPQPEQGSTEIPAVIEDLMKVDIQSVDPTELTVAQAEQLVEAALIVFETATQGSPEYEQALDALYLAAEQDDIVVDESIANIPGIGEAAVALVGIVNLFGNAGADMSPKVREQSKKIVITTVVAVGAAVNAATGAALMASAPSAPSSGGGPSGGSSSNSEYRRRKD